MLHIEKIESFDIPALMPYRTMRRQSEHEAQGIFVAEGEKVVRRLLESSFTVVSVLLPEKWLRLLKPLLLARPEPLRVFVAEKELLETLTGFSMYQGLLAVGKIPARRSLEEILAHSSRPRLLAAADGLSSAENLGALGAQLRGVQRASVGCGGDLWQSILAPGGSQLDGNSFPVADC